MLSTETGVKTHNLTENYYITLYFLFTQSYLIPGIYLSRNFPCLEKYEVRALIK